MKQRCFWLGGRGEPILTQDRRDESTGRTLALSPSNVDSVQAVEVGRLSFVSAWLHLSKTSFAVAVEAHTSYPILRHHSIISDIAFLFMLLRDFLMESTIAKLVCNVFRAATASCGIGEWEYTGEVLLAHCVTAACHRCGCRREAPRLGEKSAEGKRQSEL